MLAFIILSCLATAYAGSLGYDYGSQFVGNNGFVRQPSNNFNPVQSFTPGAAKSPEYSPPPPVAEFEKEFFTFSAPESEFNDHDVNHQFNNDVKRGLRVIFIKGPENSGLENAALQLAKSAVEQHTAIYVLNKQSDLGDLSNKFNVLNKNNNNKPEVHFVKYRTPADAENAKHAIQNEYDNLGGSSVSHDGGVASVLNFASKASLSPNSSPVVLGNAYLPANKRI